MKDVDNKIKQCLESSNIPLKAEEIANACGVSKIKLNSFIKKVNELSKEDNGEIVKITTDKDKQYYVLRKNMELNEVDATKTSIQYLAEIRDLLEETDKIAQKANKGVKNLHIEIISIMAVFVAIFSLIVTNTSLIPAIMDKAACEIIRICLTVNLSLLITIFLLLLMVNKLIIKNNK